MEEMPLSNVSFKIDISWLKTVVTLNFMFLIEKRLGDQIDHPCSFSKNVFSRERERERVKPWFFVTFNIIISYVFPENFIEIPQVFQKI